MPKFYRIRVGGHLDGSWSEWFEGLRLTYEANGETVLSGPIVDEAALRMESWLKCGTWACRCSPSIESSPDWTKEGGDHEQYHHPRKDSVA